MWNKPDDLSTPKRKIKKLNLKIVTFLRKKLYLKKCIDLILSTTKTCQLPGTIFQPQAQSKQKTLKNFLYFLKEKFLIIWDGC